MVSDCRYSVHFEDGRRVTTNYIGDVLKVGDVFTFEGRTWVVTDAKALGERGVAARCRVPFRRRQFSTLPPEKVWREDTRPGRRNCPLDREGDEQSQHWRTTLHGVKQIWTGRVAQAAGKYGEHAPMATACCNACRTCVTTNVLGLVAAGAGMIGLRLSRVMQGRNAA